MPEHKVWKGRDIGESGWAFAQSRSSELEVDKPYVEPPKVQWLPNDGGKHDNKLWKWIQEASYEDWLAWKNAQVVTSEAEYRSQRDKPTAPRPKYISKRRAEQRELTTWDRDDGEYFEIDDFARDEEGNEICRVYSNQETYRSSKSGHSDLARRYLAGEEAGLQELIMELNSASQEPVEGGTVDIVEQLKSESSGGELRKACYANGLMNDSRFLVLRTDGSGLGKATSKQLLEVVWERLLAYAYDEVLESGEGLLPETLEFSHDDMRNLSERNLAFLELSKLETTDVLTIMLSLGSLDTLMSLGLDSNGRTLQETAIQCIAQTYGRRELEADVDLIYLLIDWHLITSSSTLENSGQIQSLKEEDFMLTVGPEISL